MPQMGIRTRFTIILSLIFVVTIIIAWVIFSRVLQQQAEEEVSYQAEVLVEMLNSVRNYTSTEVKPLLADKLASDPDFIPQTVPAFSAREVFEHFRSTNEYIHFMYKEATLDPTNLRDLANDSEAEMVNRFRADSSLKELSGFTTVDGQQLFYTSRPLAITSQSCLDCHTTPEKAPASLVKTYGTEHGFGWELNQIIAAQTIYVPAEDVFARAQQSLSVVMGILVVIFAVVIIVTNAGLRRAVVSPVVQIARLAQLIGSDALKSDSPEVAKVDAIANRNDELGHTAKMIQRMAKEIREREKKLKQQIESLRIQIDTEKQAKDVNDITDSDFFQNLQKRAGNIRKRAGDNDTTTQPDATQPDATQPNPTDVEEKS